MCTLSLASDVPKDAHVFDLEVSVPRHWLSRLLARLRASVALVGGQYPRQGALRPNQTLSEIDPIARLTRDYPFFFTHLS
jgi:hypothetical protein